MTHPMLLAWSSPVSVERDAEFNEWYVGTHIPEIRQAIPGITAVQRYRVLGSGSADTPTRYVCCYELGGTDVASAAKALGEARAAGAFTPSDSMDVSSAPPDLKFVEPDGEIG